jgi:hypothetical protein
VPVVKMQGPAAAPAKPATTASIPVKIETVRTVPARPARVAAAEKEQTRASFAHAETDGAAAPASARRWSAADVTVAVLALLALASAYLARHIRRRQTSETTLHATARAQLRSRLGQGQALAREAGSRVGAAVAGVHGEASERLPFLHTLKSYVSAAGMLTIAVMIYLTSQSPAAIKTFIAHLSGAASPGSSSDR